MVAISLPEDLLKLSSVLPEMIARLEERIPYVSALAGQDSGIDLSIDSRQERISLKEPRKGVVFTLFNGRYFQEWATDNLDVEFLWKKVNDIYKISEGMKGMEPRFSIDPGNECRMDFVSDFEIDPDSIELPEMVDACKDLIQEVSGLDSKIVNTAVRYSDGKEYKVYVNRNKHLTSALTLCGIHLQVVGQHQNKTAVNMIGAGGVTGFETIRFKKKNLQEMVDDLNLLFESRPIHPGNYEVVSSPEVSGILAHEAFGHGVEADMIVKHRAKAARYMNQPVASSIVTMWDDPSLKGLNGSYFFDDEGQLSAPVAIIENGILKRSLTDLRSSAILNIPRSSNGRREGFDRKVYARMSNTYFATGTSSYEDMILSIENGLFLKRSSSGMEDPKGWGIQITIDFAQEIKNGKLTSRVFSPVTMTGYVPDLLKSISMSGTQLGFMGAGGRCGKGHKELVRVTAGGPHLKFKARLG